MWVCVKKGVHQQGSKHDCDLAPFQQHQNTGHKWATEYTVIQCDTAVPLPRMTSFTHWVWTSSLSPCSSFLFSVPTVTTGQLDRKRQNNQRGNEDILIESSPYRVLKSNISTGIQVINDTNYWFFCSYDKNYHWCYCVFFPALFTFEFWFMGAE